MITKQKGKKKSKYEKIEIEGNAMEVIEALKTIKKEDEGDMADDANKIEEDNNIVENNSEV